MQKFAFLHLLLFAATVLSGCLETSSGNSNTGRLTQARWSGDLSDDPKPTSTTSTTSSGSKATPPNSGVTGPGTPKIPPSNPPVQPPPAPPQPVANFPAMQWAGKRVSNFGFQYPPAGVGGDVLTQHIQNSPTTIKVVDVTSPTKERYFVFYLGSMMMGSGSSGGSNDVLMVTDSVGNGEWSLPKVLSRPGAENILDIAVTSSDEEILVAWAEIPLTGATSRNTYIQFSRLTFTSQKWSAPKELEILTNGTDVGALMAAYQGRQAYVFWRKLQSRRWSVARVVYEGIFTEISHVSIRDGVAGPIMHSAEERLLESRDVLTEVNGKFVDVFMSRDGLQSINNVYQAPKPKLASRTFNPATGEWEATILIDDLKGPAANDGFADSIQSFVVRKHAPTQTLAVAYWRYDKHPRVAVSCVWSPGICFETNHSLISKRNADGSWKKPTFMPPAYDLSFLGDGRAVIGGYFIQNSKFYSSVSIEQTDGTYKDFRHPDHSQFALTSLAEKDGMVYALGTASTTASGYMMVHARFAVTAEKWSDVQVTTSPMLANDHPYLQFTASGNLLNVWRAYFGTPEKYPGTQYPIGYQIAVFGGLFQIVR
jgi:hypothetical protein